MADPGDCPGALNHPAVREHGQLAALDMMWHLSSRPVETTCQHCMCEVICFFKWAQGHHPQDVKMPNVLMSCLPTCTGRSLSADLLWHQGTV